MFSYCFVTVLKLESSRTRMPFSFFTSQRAPINNRAKRIDFILSPFSILMMARSVVHAEQDPQKTRNTFKMNSSKEEKEKERRRKRKEKQKLKRWMESQGASFLGNKTRSSLGNSKKRSRSCLQVSRHQPLSLTRRILLNPARLSFRKGGNNRRRSIPL